MHRHPSLSVYCVSPMVLHVLNTCLITSTTLFDLIGHDFYPTSMTLIYSRLLVNGVWWGCIQILWKCPMELLDDPPIQIVSGCDMFLSIWLPKKESQGERGPEESDNLGNITGSHMLKIRNFGKKRGNQWMMFHLGKVHWQNGMGKNMNSTLHSILTNV